MKKPKNVSIELNENSSFNTVQFNNDEIIPNKSHNLYIIFFYLLLILSIILISLVTKS